MLDHVFFCFNVIIIIIIRIYVILILTIVILHCPSADFPPYVKVQGRAYLFLHTYDLEVLKKLLLGLVTPSDLFPKIEIWSSVPKKWHIQTTRNAYVF